MASLLDIHRSRVNGKVSNKWESYLSFYDSVFAPLRMRPVRLLEIGVQNGGSLETWSSFFPNANVIVGCDIDPRCKRLTYADPRIRVIVGDATSQDTLEKITSISPTYDVIIDDGSHRSDDIIRAFVAYFPYLTPGGLFAIEDTHTLYRKSFGGGLLRSYTATSYFKLFADVVNFEHWRGQGSIEALFRRLLRRSFPSPAFLTEGWVEAIEFRNSLILVRKAERPGHDKLGERLIVGDEAMVDDEPLRVRGATGLTGVAEKRFDREN
jgi:hypothetical protein